MIGLRTPGRGHGYGRKQSAFLRLLIEACLGIWFPKVGVIGGLLTIVMSIVTLSFLMTTPEVFVGNHGGDMPTPRYGFPYLSGAGRLVLKDIIMMGGGLAIASDSARKLVRKNK